MVEIARNENTNLLIENFGILPFNRAVSKFNIEEDPELDIVTTSRKVMDYKVNRLIKVTAIDQATRFLPIIGPAGSGKTHYYWVLKARERLISEDVKYKIIYVSSPPTPYRLYHHIYSCIADELADERFFLVMMNVILSEIGIDPQTVTPNTDQKILISRILPTFPGVFADCIKALTILRINGSHTTKGALALRWLLGECLIEDELRELQINSVLEQDDICLAMIKIISDLSGRVLVFYFDEMESPYRTFGPEAQQKFFEYIKRLYNELRNSLIITACLKDIWNQILQTADIPMLQRMEPEMYLDSFQPEDLKVYYLRAMNQFWTILGKMNPKNTYFPLSEKIIDEIYDKYKGNQRECIKSINYKIEELIFPDQVQNSADNLQNKSYSSPNGDIIIDQGVTQFKPYQSYFNNSSEIPDGDMEGEEEEKQPKPGNVLQAFFEQLNDKINALDQDFDLIHDFSYDLDDKKKKIASVLKIDQKIIGIEIPSIHTFERTAGVAGFYALRRLDDAFNANVIDSGIIIVPSETSGNKYRSMLEQNKNLIEIKIKPEDAKELVNSKAFAKTIFKNDIEKLLQN